MFSPRIHRGVAITVLLLLLAACVSSADPNVLADRFGFDSVTGLPKQITSVNISIIPCPASYPAVIQFTANGSHAILADCNISGSLTIELLPQTDPSKYENVVGGGVATLSQFDMVNNVISAPVLILGNVLDVDATTVNDSMLLALNISKNTAQFDVLSGTNNCSAFAIGVTGKFLHGTQIEIFENDLSKLFGENSNEATNAGDVGSLVCALSTLYTRLCDLDPTGQSQCAAGLEFTVGGVVAPFLVSAASFGANAVASWIRIHSNTVVLVLDPVTLVADPTSSLSPTIYMSALAVVSSPHVSGDSTISFDTNNIAIYTAINAAVNSSIGVVSSAVFVGQSTVVLSTGSNAIFQITENTFTTQIIDSLNGAMPGNNTHVSVEGGGKSTMSFLYIRPSAQLSATSGSQQSFSYNLITFQPQLPVVMRNSDTYNGVSISNISRVGFADIWSGGGASIKFAASSGSSFLFDKNMVLIEQMEAVSSVVVGAGFIPDGLDEIAAGTTDTNHLMQVTISQSSKLSFQRCFVRLYTSDDSVLQSQVVSSNTRQYIPFAGMAIPPTMQVITSSSTMIDRNLVILRIGVSQESVEVGSTTTTYRSTDYSGCICLGGSSSLLSQSTLQIGGNTLRFIVINLDSIVARTTAYPSTVVVSRLFTTEADSAKKYVGPFIFAARKASTTGSDAGLVIDSASFLSLLDNTAEVYDSEESSITKSELGFSRTPRFLVGTVTRSVSTGEIRICSQSKDEYLGTSAITRTTVNGTTSVSFVPEYLQLDNNGGTNTIPTPVEEADCLPVLTQSISISLEVPVVYVWVESDRERYIRIALSTTVTVGAGFLCIAMIVGGSITELQLFVALYLSKCGSQHDEKMMYVLRYFYSFFIDLGDRDVIIAHCVIGPMIAIIWLAVMYILSKLWDLELKELCQQLIWPTGPLLIIKFLYPGLVISSLRVIGTAGGVIGAIIAAIEAVVFTVIVIRTSDRYFLEQPDMPEALVFPGGTFSLHRGIMYLYSTGIGRPFALTPIVVSWLFGVFLMDKVQESAGGCITGYILVMVLCVLLAVVFVLIQPHGTIVRSFLYAWTYVWLGCTAIAIYDDHLNAKFAFAVLFFCGIFFLALHTVIAFMYVFLMQDSEDLAQEKPLDNQVVYSKKAAAKNELFQEANEERKGNRAIDKADPNDPDAAKAAAKKAKSEAEIADLYYGRKKAVPPTAEPAKKKEAENKKKSDTNNEPISSNGDEDVEMDSDEEEIMNQRKKKEANDADLEAYYGGKNAAPSEMQSSDSSTDDGKDD